MIGGVEVVGDLDLAGEPFLQLGERRAAGGRREHRDRHVAATDLHLCAILDLAEQPREMGFGLLNCDAAHLAEHTGPG